MGKSLKRIITFITSVVLVLLSTTVYAENTADTGFDYLEYPNAAITDFCPDILDRVSAGDDYVSNRGYGDTSLYISPYWTLNVCGEEIPVYATLSYDEDCGGVLQSYQYIFADGNDFRLDIKLCFTGNIENAVCLPEKEDISSDVNGNTLSAIIGHTGAFTFLINNESQEYAVTVFVRHNYDESEKISSYKEQYGEENVRVFEKGFYELDSVPTDKTVTYFCRGSFIKANHLTDVTKAEDQGNACEFMAFEGPDGSVIDGLGTIDFNSLDWHERTHCILRWKKNVRVKGLVFLNPSSWTLSTYGCENCTIEDITVFGYRTNSDGINICGCSNMSIRNSFCRNGDDCFSVKTTNDVYEANNIKFSKCIGWSNKARCFGITGEVFRKISDVNFTDCAVIYRNAVWNIDRVCSLSVMVGSGGEDIENVSFRNIEIHHDTGRPVIVMIEEDSLNHCKISNVSFENIICSGGEKLRFSTQRDITGAGMLAARISRLITGSGLIKYRIFALINEVLSGKYNSNNSISFTVNNVTVNGEELNIGKHCTIQGNTYCEIA